MSAGVKTISFALFLFRKEELQFKRDSSNLESINGAKDRRSQVFEELIAQ